MEMKGNNKKSASVNDEIRRCFVARLRLLSVQYSPLLLINLPRQFLTSVDQIIISFQISWGEKSSVRWKQQRPYHIRMFLRKNPFLFRLLRFQRIANDDPSGGHNPQINENTNKIQKWVEKWIQKTKLYQNLYKSNAIKFLQINECLESKKLLQY